MFEATELSYTYPSGRRGLRPVTIAADPGDRVVVMGPNGSGKSTLLRLVSTELASSRGSLKLFANTYRRPPRNICRKIGIVQDTPVHLEDLTGMENGLLFAELYGMDRTEAARALLVLFALLGLDDAAHVATKEYSYGMSKKLLIAEALVHDPELLILDEPVLGLDPPTRAALLRMLRERSEKGVCTLVATNDPVLAQDLATTVIFLHDGEVVEQGSPAELMGKVGRSTRIEIHITDPSTREEGGGPTPAEYTPADLTTTDPTPTAETTKRLALKELPAEITAIHQLPGKIVAESESGSDMLPWLVDVVLGAGLKIERIELREPDLTDVFEMVTGQALKPVTV